MSWAARVLPALLLDHACSSDLADEPAIVPEGLSVTALPGGTGGLNITALTLRAGAQGLQLYAAVRNAGDAPACHAALSVELFDKAEQSLAAGISGLLAQHFYERVGDEGAIAACIGPGEVSMAAVLDVSSETAVEDVAHIVYRCPYFALDVRPVAGLDITRLSRVARPDGAAYAGTLRNNLDVALRNPSVSVFPIARSGRPLDMVSASDTDVVPPDGTWTFETPTIQADADHQLAFPAGALD